MGQQIIDLSIAIEDSLPSDPEMMIPRIDYVTHEQGADQMEMSKDFIFRNTFADLERIMKVFKETGTKPEFEAYNKGTNLILMN